MGWHDFDCGGVESVQNWESSVLRGLLVQSLANSGMKARAGWEGMEVEIS